MLGISHVHSANVRMHFLRFLFTKYLTSDFSQHCPLKQLSITIQFTNQFSDIFVSNLLYFSHFCMTAQK